MNKVILIGRLTADPELRYLANENNSGVCRFTVAVESYVKKESKEKNVYFINCVCFGKRAETIGKYFFKGDKIALSGKLHVRNYTDKAGNKRYSTDVVVYEFDFCEKNEKRNSESAAGDTSVKFPSEQADGFYSMGDNDNSDLPF